MYRYVNRLIEHKVIYCIGALFIQGKLQTYLNTYELTFLNRICSFFAVKPPSRPLVSGVRPSYRAGDRLNATCSLADTFPAANLTWFISGQRVRELCQP